jgi:hypothetical protein
MGNRMVAGIFIGGSFREVEIRGFPLKPQTTWLEWGTQKEFA